jgi:hypothetical protein
MYISALDDQSDGGIGRVYRKKNLKAKQIYPNV